MTGYAELNITGPLHLQPLLQLRYPVAAAVHLNGHYTFRGDGKLIDLDAVMAGLDLA